MRFESKMPPTGGQTSRGLEVPAGGVAVAWVAVNKAAVTTAADAAKEDTALLFV